MTTTAIIDYGMGNLHSVASALRHAGAHKVVITQSAEEIQQADRVIFPGVGAIGACMDAIASQRCDELLRDAAQRQHKPVLAICVGMQALMRRSDESGGTDCLGLLDGEVRHFGSPLLNKSGAHLKVPHMGWNKVQHTRQHPLWHNIDSGSRFYFVHSYYVSAEDSELVAGRVQYGVEADAALAADNIFAVQFHPEKSHTVGLQLLSNFLNWDGQC